MPLGGGTYNDEINEIREKTETDSVILLIIGVKKGNGFEIMSCNPLFQFEMPAILRNLANEIEAIHNKGEL